MRKCICEDCYNLKNETIENEEYFTCEFGFPDDACEDCTCGECEFTCEKFSPIEEITANCAMCSKELNILSSNEEGEYFCMDCYLKK